MNGENEENPPALPTKRPLLRVEWNGMEWHVLCKLILFSATTVAASRVKTMFFDHFNEKFCARFSLFERIKYNHFHVA